MKTTQLNKLITTTLDEHKAENITTLDVRQTTNFTDYMIICSATSTRQIKALSNHLVVELKKHQVKPLGVEGDTGADEWALIDCGDILVHIMLPQTREFYSLEKLWGTPTTTANTTMKTTKKKTKKTSTGKATTKSTTKKKISAKPKIKKKTTSSKKLKTITRNKSVTTSKKTSTKKTSTKMRPQRPKC